MATKTATVARLDFARRRRGYKRARLLEEHPDGGAYKLVVEVTKRFYVARVRETPGGPLVDKLLIDETDQVTQEKIERTVVVDLLMSNDVTTRYTVDGGFITPVGRVRRYIGTLRVNKTDESPINV
jgi:hypothetical protein